MSGLPHGVGSRCRFGRAYTVSLAADGANSKFLRSVKLVYVLVRVASGVDSCCMVKDSYE